MVCEDCEEDKEDAVDTICPYNEDVHGQSIEVKLCTDCYNNRCWDI